jgi:predicted metal-dependent phosphoesterase TrpH
MASAKKGGNRLQQIVFDRKTGIHLKGRECGWLDNPPKLKKKKEINAEIRNIEGVKDEELSRVDAHLHSNHSDGSRSPKKIVALAQKAGLKLIVLTDHDCIGGQRDFLRYANKAGLYAFSGIEITASHMGVEVHILGYGIKHESSSIENLLRPNIEARRERLNKSLFLLAEHGVVRTTEDEIKEWCNYKGPVVSIHHAIEYVAEITGRSFFEIKALFKRGGIAWTQYDYSKIFSASEAVRIVTRELGGVAVLAHPGEFLKAASYHEEHFHQNAWHFLRVTLLELKKEGLCGIESFHSTHSDEQRENFLTIASQLGLKNTAGSDFHGKFKRNKRLGMSGIIVPDFLDLMS